MSRQTDPIFHKFYLLQLIIILRRMEVPHIISLKSRMKRAPRRLTSLMGTFRGHTTLLQARMKRRNFRVSRMLTWVISLVGQSKSKNTSGHHLLHSQLHDLIRGENSLAILMFLIKLIATVISAVIFG